MSFYLPTDIDRNVAAGRLCRDITRPAIANERLKRDGAGNVVLQLKSPWRDGTTHIRMSPLQFMQPLAALVPRPRLHLIRFHGVLAPNAGLRAGIVPGPPEKPGVPAVEHAHGAPVRMGWGRLLKRVFERGDLPETAVYNLDQRSCALLVGLFEDRIQGRYSDAAWLAALEQMAAE